LLTLPCKTEQRRLIETARAGIVRRWSVPGRPPGGPGRGLILVLCLAVFLSIAVAPVGCFPQPAAHDSDGGAEDEVAAGGGDGWDVSFSELMDGPLANELPGEFLVYFLDVGQADASLGRTPDGKVFLVDTGDGSDEVAAFLEAKEVERVDLMILTHPHADHIGGALRVLEAFNVGVVADSGYPHTSDLYAELLEKVTELRSAGLVSYTNPRAGDTLEVGPALTAVVLHPGDTLPDEANNASVVVRFVFGSFSVLFTGDCEKEGEEAVLARWGEDDLASTVLKVGHHGSSSSSTPAFLAAVAPEAAVIQVGKDNPYGHPSAAVLQRLADAGTAVYLTSSDGTVIVHSDGEAWEIVVGP